jgi:hypothetical protein
MNRTFQRDNSAGSGHKTNVRRMLWERVSRGMPGFGLWSLHVFCVSPPAADVRSPSVLHAVHGRNWRYLLHHVEVGANEMNE